MAKYVNGKHVPDTTPVEVPLSYRHETQDMKIAAAVTRELSRRAEEIGMESEDEFNDFEMDEDPDPLTRYEIEDDMPEEYLYDPREEPVNAQPSQSAGVPAEPLREQSEREYPPSQPTPKRRASDYPAQAPSADPQGQSEYHQAPSADPQGQSEYHQRDVIQPSRV